MADGRQGRARCCRRQRDWDRQAGCRDMPSTDLEARGPKGTRLRDRGDEATRLGRQCSPPSSSPARTVASAASTRLLVQRRFTNRRVGGFGVSRSCIAGAPELVEQLREDRQQVACRIPDRQAQRVAEPGGVEACNPCPDDVRPHTGLGKQLVQMGKLWIFPGGMRARPAVQGPGTDVA